MTVLLLALLVLPPSSPAQAAAPCDSLYTAAETARADVGDGLGNVRSSDVEKRQWRQTVQRLVATAERVRACYTPLSPSSDEPDASAPSRSEDAPLPTPTVLARQRVMQSYDWTTLGYRELQAYDAAFRAFDRFFDRFGTAADSSRIAFMYNKRAYLHYTLGNLTASIDDYTRTIAHTPAADTLSRAELMIDLGVILQKIDDLGAAQDYYGQAGRLIRKASASMRQREILGRALFNQGDVLKLRRPEDTDATWSARLRQAIDLLQESIAVFPDEWASRRARAHVILGDAYRMTGDLDAASRHVERGRRLAQAPSLQSGSRADLLALAARVEGQVDVAAGRLDAAIATLNEALRFAEDGDNRPRRYHVLLNLGQAHEANGSPVRAETYYRQAFTITNELRASLRATEWASLASRDWSAPLRGLTRVLLAQDRPGEAFLALDRSRARHLQDRQMQTRLTNTLPPRERVRFDSLTATLADVRNALATDELSTDRRSALEQDEVRLMAARRALLDLSETATLSSVTALQAQLRTQQRALIAYYIDEAAGRDRPPASHAFVVTPNAFRTVPLSVSADTIRDQLSAVSPLLGTTDSPVNRRVVNFDLEALHQLYTDLFAPVADVLPPDAPVTIVPDGPLFRLPFSMLVTEPPGLSLYTNAPYLLRERVLSMELSAALIGDTTRTTGRFPLDIAALGRTRFERVPALPPALRSRLDSTGALPALPGVEREIEAVGERFARRRVALNDQATEDRLHTLLPQTKIFHLASHALIHPSEPLANLFVLSPDRSGDARNDGLLFVHELDARRAPVPLVVLSACGTAQGLMRTGEGPKGLQYAFRSAGARSTLSTLWDAEDDASVLLTSAFYDHLLEGLPKDVALQQAQLDVIDQRPDQASPFFWAGVVLYGTPHPLRLEPASPIPLLPVAAGGALLLLIALGFGYACYRRHWS